MRKYLALLLVLVLAVQAYAAATTSTGIDCAGLPRIVLTVNAATTGDVVCTDTGTLYGKRAQVIRTVSNGETKYVLVRIQKAGNGLFIDEIAAETTTALATRIAAFDLTSTALGHPSPVNDTADDECATLMVGYAP
jgi:hypothetical protein